MTTELQKEREQIKFNPKEVNYFWKDLKKDQILSAILLNKWKKIQY